jgi:glycosyltransferase involved in cell wall biosynthesis
MNENNATPRHDATDVSVVVCTYNRSQQIERALLHIGAAAMHANLSVEIVVVDNNSRDDTKAVVASVARISAIPVRYVFEPAQGLSFARNRGLKASNGSIIAFTDDDCLVDPTWIAALWGEFVANPDVAVLGGRVTCMLRRINPSRSANRECVPPTLADLVDHGCNTPPPWRTIGGPIRHSAAKCDDIEFVYRALRQGLGILYTPKALVLHNHGRRTAEDLRALGRSYVRGRGAFFCKCLLNADRTIFRHVWWEVRARHGSGPASANQLSHRETLCALASGALHFILTRTGLARP